METAKISLWEVIIGIWILAIVVILGGIFFVPEPLSYALGEIAGSITASGLMVHLYRSIDIELDLPEKKAVSHSRAMGLVRSAIEIGVLVGSFFLSKWVMPYTVLAGLLARKAAALMVPWMEKIRLRKKKIIIGKESESVDGVDFYVYGHLPIHIGGVTVYITTTHICLAIVMAALIIFAIAANRKIKKADPTKAPTGFLNVIELLVETLDNLVKSNMGKTLAPKFKNYIGVIFMFLVTCNLSGLFGLRPPTADYGTTLPLALITFVMIQYQGIKWQKWGKLKGLFEPIFLFFPINVISEFATPVSLSLRLFANILSGTMMMALIYGLLPKFLLWVWPAALHAYLDVFAGALQAYVFAMLTMVFIANAADLDD